MSEPSAEALKYAARVIECMIALEDFYEPRESERWLNSPHRMLGNLRPIDLLWTDHGAQCVMDQLDLLRSGAYL